MKTHEVESLRVFRYDTKELSDDLVVATPERAFKLPDFEVSPPVSAVPVDRLALSANRVRPAAAGIDGSVNPAGWMFCSQLGWCFEGNEK